MAFLHGDEGVKKEKIRKLLEILASTHSKTDLYILDKNTYYSHLNLGENTKHVIFIDDFEILKSLEEIFTGLIAGKLPTQWFAVTFTDVDKIKMMEKVKNEDIQIEVYCVSLENDMLLLK